MSSLDMEVIVAGGGKTAMMNKIIEDIRAKVQNLRKGQVSDLHQVLAMIETELWTVQVILNDGRS